MNDADRQELGTTVFMSLNNHTSRTVKKIFDRYTSDEDSGFNTTVVPLKLAQYGNDKLISRSQAKRVLARTDLLKSSVWTLRAFPASAKLSQTRFFGCLPTNIQFEVNAYTRQFRSKAHD